MSFRASFIENGKVVNRYFKSLDTLKEYSLKRSIRPHNLFEETDLEDLAKDALVVIIEGDTTLYDTDLHEHIVENKHFNTLLLNNIYEEPLKLLTLKGKEVNTLVVQSTGVYKDMIKDLIAWYTKEIGIYPKNLVGVHGDENIILKDLLKSSPHKIHYYTQPHIVDERLHLTKWIGVKNLWT